MNVTELRNALLAVVGFVLMAFLTSDIEALGNLFVSPWLTMTFNYETMEPVFLGTIVLLTIFAVLVSSCLDMMRSLGFRPIADCSAGGGSIRLAFRRIANSTPAQTLKQDGIRGVLRLVGGSMVSAFRQSWPCRVYRWVRLRDEVAFATMLLLPPTLYAVHNNLGRLLYAYVAGLEAGFTSIFGTQTAQCQHLRGGFPIEYDNRSYDTFLQFFCKGELDGLYMQSAWDLFVEEQLSNLDFLVHLLKIAGAFVAGGAIIAGLVHRANAFGLMAEASPDLPAPRAVQEAMQTEKVNEPGSGSGATGTDEDGTRSSSDDDDDDQLLGGQQREPNQCNAPAGLTSTQSEGRDHPEVSALRSMVEELDGARKLAVERQTAADKKCEELTASLEQARRASTREELAKLLANDRYTAFRKLADNTADQGLLEYFREFEKLAGSQVECPGSVSSAEELVGFRKAVSTEFPDLLDKATTFRQAERQKVANYVTSLEEERHGYATSLEEERVNSRSLASQLANATAEGRQHAESASEAAAQLDALRQEHSKLREAHVALGEEKKALAEERTADVSNLAARDRQIDELKEKNDDLVKEILHYDGGSRQMGEDIRKRFAASATTTTEAAAGPVNKQANAEAAERLETLQQQLAGSAERESALRAEMEQVNAQLAEKVSQETSTQQATQQQLADAADREAALQTELGQAKQALAEGELQATCWQDQARAEAEALVQSHHEALMEKDSENQQEVEDLQKRVRELEDDRQRLKQERLDQPALQDARVEIVQKQVRIDELTAQLAHAAETTVDERANEQIEQLRTRVQVLEASESQLTTSKIELTSKLAAAEEEAKKARISLTNSGTNLAKAGLVAPKKPHPLQAKVNELKKQLDESQAALAEMTRLKAEAVAALKADDELPGKKRQRKENDG